MIVVTTKHGYSANMERISRGQAFGNKSATKATKILEINFRHPVIKSLNTKIAEDPDSDEAQDLAHLLFDSALLQSGFIIEADAITKFAARVDRIVRQGLNVGSEEVVEAMPEFAEEDEDEEDDDEEDDDEDDEDAEVVEDAEDAEATDDAEVEDKD